jgi:prolipoprotein diacylglyceryltransferase
MHPSFLYEILFHLIAFIALVGVGGRLRKPGDGFKAYLVAYAFFRFVVEFVRDNPEMAFGLSGSQIFLLCTIPLGVSYLLWRRKSQQPLGAEVTA